MASKNKRRKLDLPTDQTKERLESILGHKVGVKFLEWYRHDTTGSGYNIPGLKYSGPGNPTNIGDPVNDADRFAQKHDLQYAHAAYKYSKGSYTREEFENKISAADTEFLASNGSNITSSMDPREQLSSIIGGAGIGIKKVFEAVAGQKYPDTDPTKAFTEHPEGEKKLANTLMQNFQKNISNNSEVGQDRPMHKIRVLNSKDHIGGDVSSSTDGAHKSPGIGIDESPVQVNEVSSTTDAAMSMPGSAAPQGDAGQAGMVMYQSPQPFTNFNNKTTTYRKVHRVMTFGLAHVNLDSTPTGTPVELQGWTTTPLASIPWNKPYFYMSPGEYAILGPNAHVQELKLNIVHRGNRVAFNTNASVTALATLNNVQNIMMAYGLNKSGTGVDMVPTTVETAPMIPTTLTRDEKNQQYINSWYGYPPTATDWKKETPDVLLGFKNKIVNYFNMVTSRTTNNFGAPNLAKNLMIMDGKTTINQTIGSFSYKPQKAPLKRESEFRRFGLPSINDSISTINIERNRHNQHTLSLDYNNPTATARFVEGDILQQPLNTVINTNLPDGQGKFDAESYYLKDIEKGNYMVNGLYTGTGDGTIIQPSIHIGVQAIPALSGTAIASLDDTRQFTDCQADWEIVAEMVVSEGEGVDFAWSSIGNKAISDITMVTKEPNTNSCIINGRHTQNGIRPGIFSG